MTYYELFHEPSRNLLADFDSQVEAFDYVQNVMIDPDIAGLRLYLVEPNRVRELVAAGMQLLQRTEVTLGTPKLERPRVTFFRDVLQIPDLTMVQTSGRPETSRETMPSPTLSRELVAG
jgi:hypothetical protein